MPNAATIPQRQVIQDQRRALVDEYGQLLAKLAPYKPDMARLADLAKSIRSWSETEKPDANVIFQGNKFIATLGPCGMESRIPDMEAVLKSLGRKRFLAACSMTLKGLEAAGGDVAALTVKEQTGSRNITVSEVPKTP